MDEREEEGGGWYKIHRESCTALFDAHNFYIKIFPCI